ncbi:MAG TPA: UDP-N-acetylmuramoyl-L-alanine--D-glutamate ligase, partial [Clostridia bacterium]|nr:UDP-N-acetylmuramoyl-L-alanine--D-glutamate ligase [Clostridia bacterium]
PDASIKALDSFDQPIILIAGGRNKGNDFLSFSEKVKQKARLVVTLGECADEIEDSFLSVGFKDFTRAEGFEEAVLEANKNAKPGDLVLLSPACASWDMFGSYEERGKLFKKVVNDLEVTKCR